jgi:hypothetical protein
MGSKLKRCNWQTDSVGDISAIPLAIVQTGRKVRLVAVDAMLKKGVSQ